MLVLVLLLLCRRINQHWQSTIWRKCNRVADAAFCTLALLFSCFSGHGCCFFFTANASSLPLPRVATVCHCHRRRCVSLNFLAHFGMGVRVGATTRAGAKNSCCNSLLAFFVWVCKSRLLLFLFKDFFVKFIFAFLVVFLRARRCVARCGTLDNSYWIVSVWQFFVQLIPKRFYCCSYALLSACFLVRKKSFIVFGLAVAVAVAVSVALAESASTS